MFALLDMGKQNGSKCPKGERACHILPSSRSIAPGQALYHLVMEQVLIWQKRCVNKHLFGVISDS